VTAEYGRKSSTVTILVIKDGIRELKRGGNLTRDLPRPVAF
jgi:hypothetical protein